MRPSTGIFMAIVTLSLLINLRFTTSSSSETMAAVSKQQPSCQSTCSACDNPCQPLTLPPPPPPPLPPSPPPPQSLPPPATQNCPPPPTVPVYVYPPPPSNCPGACNPILPYFPFYYQSPPAAANSAADLGMMRFFGFPAVGTILLCSLCLL